MNLKMMEWMMLDEHLIQLIFESSLPYSTLSNMTYLPESKVVEIRMGLSGTRYTKNCKPGLKLFRQRNPSLEDSEIEFICQSRLKPQQLAKKLYVTEDVIYNILQQNKPKTMPKVPNSISSTSINADYKQNSFGQNMSLSQLTKTIKSPPQSSRHVPHRYPDSRISKDTAMQIIQLLPTHTDKELSEMFSVSRKTITYIRNNRTWKKLPRHTITSVVEPTTQVYADTD